jgi:hypothetical protein
MASGTVTPGVWPVIAVGGSRPVLLIRGSVRRVRRRIRTVRHGVPEDRFDQLAWMAARSPGTRAGRGRVVPGRGCRRGLDTTVDRDRPGTRRAGKHATVQPAGPRATTPMSLSDIRNQGQPPGADDPPDPRREGRQRRCARETAEMLSGAAAPPSGLLAGGTHRCSAHPGRRPLPHAGCAARAPSCLPGRARYHRRRCGTRSCRTRSTPPSRSRAHASRRCRRGRFPTRAGSGPSVPKVPEFLRPGYARRAVPRPTQKQAGTRSQQKISTPITRIRRHYPVPAARSPR